MERTAEIPTTAIETVDKRVEKLNRRAVKLGLPTVTVTYSEPWIHEYKVNDVTRVEERTNATLHGEDPVISGWTFVARLEHLMSEDVLVNRVPGVREDLDLSAYRHADPVCQHCAQDRQRKDTFLLINEDQEIKQVGRTCLSDFLGHTGPLDYVWWIDAFDDALEESEGGWSRGPSMLVTRDYLIVVAAVIAHEGWLSKTSAYNYGGVPTANRASDELWKGKQSTLEITEDDVKLADAAIAWARALTEEHCGSSDYLHNLHVVLKANHLDHKHCGLAASLISAYKRACGEEAHRKAKAERPAVEKASEFEGTEKTRQKFTFTVDKITSWTNDYGTTVNQHIMTSQDGNTLVWRASDRELEIGAVYTGTFRVESHDDNPKYGKQTKISRPGKDLEIINPAPVTA